MACRAVAASAAVLGLARRGFRFGLGQGLEGGLEGHRVRKPDQTTVETLLPPSAAIGRHRPVVRTRTPPSSRPHPVPSPYFQPRKSASRFASLRVAQPTLPLRFQKGVLNNNERDPPHRAPAEHCTTGGGEKGKKTERASFAATLRRYATSSPPRIMMSLVNPDRYEFVTV